MPISCNRSGYIGTIAYAKDAVKLEGEPFSQVVELSGERLSLAGGNARKEKTTEARNGNGGKRYSIKQDAKKPSNGCRASGSNCPRIQPNSVLKPVYRNAEKTSNGIPLTQTLANESTPGTGKRKRLSEWETLRKFLKALV